MTRCWSMWAALFTILVVCWSGVWEPAHDEGVTWTQAFGSPEVPGCQEGSAPIGTLLDRPGGARYGLADLVAALRADGMHPPLYYALVQASSRWLGTQRWGLVFPALAFGLFGLYAMGRVARELAPGPSAAGLGMALLSLSPWFLGYSVFVRPYATAVVFALLSTWSVLEIGAAAGDGRRRAFATGAFVLASVCGLYTVYHYALVVVWQVVALVGLAVVERSNVRRRLGELGAALGVVFLAFLPWLPIALDHLALTSGSSFYFAGFPDVSEWPGETGHLLLVFLLGEGMWSSWGRELALVTALAGSITIPLLVASFVPPRHSSLAPAARFLWWAAPLVPLLLLATDGFRDTRTLWISKSAFALFPLLLFLLVRAVQQFQSRLGRAIAWGVWPLIFALSSGLVIRSSEQFYTGHETLAHVLGFEDQSTHRVVLSSNARGYLVPFLLDARKAGLHELEVSVAGPDTLALCLESLLLNSDVSRVTLVDFDVPYRREERWGPLPVETFKHHVNRSSWDLFVVDPGDPRLTSENSLEVWRQSLQSTPDDERRSLLLFTPSKVKYFSE